MFFTKSRLTSDVILDMSRGVLELAYTGLGEPVMCILSQLHIQWHSTGGLKSAMVGEYTPWKLANVTNQSFFFS